MAGIGFSSTNYITKVGNGLGGRTLIVEVTKGTGSATEANLSAVIKALGNAGGSGTGTDQNGPDAFTVAGVAGTVGTDPVYLALQGTGTVSQGAGDYVADITLTVVAEFKDNA